MNTIFTCKRCGFCCHGETTVSLDSHDQASILEVLQISKEEAFCKYLRSTPNEVQMQTVDGHCVFFKNGCTVHEGRPERCREWPLVKAILVDEKNLETIRSSCPGFNKTASYSDVCAAVKLEIERRNAKLKKE